jgi:hypothetical protein
MIRPIEIAAAILVFCAPPAFAQSSNPSPTHQGAQPSTVVGPTLTMYDGNNANLQLPAQPNAYWAGLWAQPGAQNNAGVASAVGAGAAGTTKTGGEH